MWRHPDLKSGAKIRWQGLLADSHYAQRLLGTQVAPSTNTDRGGCQVTATLVRLSHWWIGELSPPHRLKQHHGAISNNTGINSLYNLYICITNLEI